MCVCVLYCVARNRIDISTSIESNCALKRTAVLLFKCVQTGIFGTCTWLFNWLWQLYHVSISLFRYMLRVVQWYIIIFVQCMKNTIRVRYCVCLLAHHHDVQCYSILMCNACFMRFSSPYHNHSDLRSNGWDATALRCGFCFGYPFCCFLPLHAMQSH